MDEIAAMSHGEGIWRARWRAITRVGSFVGAIAMASFFLYGLGRSVPDRSVAQDLGQGDELLARGDFKAAIDHYDQVLESVPDSATARLGLACSFYLEGARSTAALELTKGLEAGAFEGQLGHCGHGLELNDVFFAAKLGLSDAFAVPKVPGAGRFEAALLSEPTGTTPSEPGRLLIGACLAVRAGILGIAWNYAANAIETGAIDPADRVAFLACMDGRARRRMGCVDDPGIRTCAMTRAAGSAYFRASDQANAPEASRSSS